MKLLTQLAVVVALIFFGGLQVSGVQSNDLDAGATKPPVTVHLTDGSSIESMLWSIGDSSIEIAAEATPIQLAFEKIASLSFNSTDNGGDRSDASAQLPRLAQSTRGELTFVDQSFAHFRSVVVEGDIARVSTVAGALIETGVANLKTISFIGDQSTDQERDQWKELIAQDLTTSDAIVVSKNGTLQLIEGVVGDISDQHLTFSMETRTAKVGLEKIKGVLFYRAQREFTEPSCQLVLSDDSAISVRTIALKDSQFEVTSTCGLELAVDVSRIDRIDFSIGRVVFLSDLIPSTNTWTPLLASPEIVQPLKSLRLAKFNRDMRGEMLTLRNVPESGLSYLTETVAYEKGIAISGGGRVVFALNGQFKQLTGMVGFDPNAFIGGVVRFEVKTDGQVAISEVMRAEETLQGIALSLDVTETERISISVQYEDGKPAGDVLHLVDLKVSR